MAKIAVIIAWFCFLAFAEAQQIQIVYSCSVQTFFSAEEEAEFLARYNNKTQAKNPLYDQAEKQMQEMNTNAVDLD